MVDCSELKEKKSPQFKPHYCFTLLRSMFRNFVNNILALYPCFVNVSFCMDAYKVFCRVITWLCHKCIESNIEIC